MWYYKVEYRLKGTGKSELRGVFMDIKRIDRAITNKAEIYHIVNTANFLHLGLLDGNYPYIVPLHYGFEYLETSDTFLFYMHGAKEGHKIDLIRQSPNVFIEIETDVALFSGEENPCKYGAFYSSFMGRGQVSLVEDTNEQKKALQLLMKNQTKRDFEFTNQMLSTVAIIKVFVNDYTAKARKR